MFFLFCRTYNYINICNNTTPHTQGSPNIPLPPTVYQLIGICTPVNFCVRFITAIAAKDNIALKNIDRIGFLLLICNTSNIKAQIDNHIIASIPKAFKKITYYRLYVKANGNYECEMFVNFLIILDIFLCVC